MSVVNLSSSGHSSQFLENLTTLFVAEDRLDLIFVCDKNVFVKAHKLVLASVSKFIKLLLLHEKDVVYISLPGVEGARLRILINFLYEGITKVSESELHDLKDLMILLDIELHNAEIRNCCTIVKTSNLILNTQNRQNYYCEEQNVSLINNPVSANWILLNRGVNIPSADEVDIALQSEPFHFSSKPANNFNVQEFALSKTNVVDNTPKLEDLIHQECSNNCESEYEEFSDSDDDDVEASLNLHCVSPEDSHDEPAEDATENYIGATPVFEKPAVDPKSAADNDVKENMRNTVTREEMRENMVLDNIQNVQFGESTTDSKMAIDVCTPEKMKLNENQSGGRARFFLTKDQKQVLEEIYKKNKFPKLPTLLEISDDLHAPGRTIINWFTNRRSKDKKGKLKETGTKSNWKPKNSKLNYSTSFDTSTRQLPVAIDDRPYKCHTCNAAFRQQGNLDTHKRIHTGEKPYKCSTCGVSFVQRSHLQQHSRLHSGEKPYICEVCETRFTQLAHLQRHSRLHSGEKPYKCEVCAAKFSQKSNLQHHFRLHSGEKPYKCEVCAAKFSRKSYLQQHFRLHSGEKPYKCDICDFASAQMAALISHVKLHDEKRLYKCDYCKSGYNTMNHLKNHIKVHCVPTTIKNIAM